MVSRRSDAEFARAFKALEDEVCDVCLMVQLAFLAHKNAGANTPELVLFALNQLDGLSKGLRAKYYAGFEETHP